MSRLLLGFGLLAGILLRLRFAFGDDGIYWPDEVYQSLEPAHRLVFGYGLVAWEFASGARSWALPGLVAGMMKLAALARLPEPEGYLGLVRVAFVAMSAACAVGVERLARARGATPLAAAAAAVGYALAAPVVYFAHRALGGNVAAVLCVFGLALTLDPAASRRRLAAGASLLGAAVLFRLQAGALVAGALVVIVARRDRARSLVMLGVLSAWAFGYGLLDRLTWGQLDDARWGGWFHSALVYLDFNLVGGGASAWGVSEPGYYVAHLFTSLGLLAVPLLAGVLLAARRAPGLLALTLAFVALHSAVPHKELRFVLPALPPLFALAGIGISAIPSRPARGAALALVLVTAVASAAHTPALTFGELGAYPERAGASAWDDNGPINRLLRRASRLPDLCGLRVDVDELAWTGGLSSLHRRVPLYGRGVPRESGRFNYLITARAAPLAALEHDDGFRLVRLPQAGCEPDPAYRWRLP